MQGEASGISEFRPDHTQTATSADQPADAAPQSAWDEMPELTQIYLDHYQKLVRLAALMLSGCGTAEAEDAVQDAFVSAARHYNDLQDPDNFLAYVRQAVTNKVKSLGRRAAVRRRVLPRLLPGELFNGTPEPTRDVDERNVVIAALLRLPERQRTAIVWKYYGDLSEAEIASVMQVSPGTVKSHTSRGMANLRVYLIDD